MQTEETKAGEKSGKEEIFFLFSRILCILMEEELSVRTEGLKLKN